MQTPTTIPFGSKPLTTSTTGATIPFGGASSAPTSTASATSTPPKPTTSLADSIWSGITSSVQQGGNAVNQAFTAPGKNPVSQGFDASVAAAEAVPNVAASVVPGGKEVLGALGKVGGGIIDFLGGLLGGTKQAQDFVAQHPDATKALEDAATVGKGAGSIASTVLGAGGVAGGADATLNAVKGATDTANGASYFADSLKPEPPPTPVIAKTPDYSNPTLLKIQDLIAPKVNAAAVKQALAEGRIAPGQEPGLLRDGTPDQILPTTKMVQASKTIEAQIPGAVDMSQAELHGALDGKITEIATKLKPEMQAVPITDEILGKIQDSWDALKTKQQEDPYASTGANLDKLQAQFQSKFLEPLIGKRFSSSLNESLGTGEATPTMDSLWDTAKAYDNSVPVNVKNASSISTDALQTQKAIWLQNRAILRNAINDTSTGLGETSQTAFSNMSDMYQAQKGIQSSYKLSGEGAPSKVEQFKTSPTGKKIGTFVKYGAGIEGVKKVVTGHF